MQPMTINPVPGDVDVEYLLTTSVAFMFTPMRFRTPPMADPMNPRTRRLADGAGVFPMFHRVLSRVPD